MTNCRATIGLFLVAAASACTAVEPLATDRAPIIGGDAVADGELPTVVGIATNAGTICTGTLISPTAVLTAAHCVEPMLLKQAMQQAGQTPPEVIEYSFSFANSLRQATTGEFIEVASVEWHEQFLTDIGGLFERPGRWHDIAVMHLAAPVTGQRTQRLAPADVVDTLELGRTQLVAGYGLTVDGDPMTAGSLTKGVSNLDAVGPNELIAGVGDAQQACRGDSGGPIFADDSDTYQIGIASRINAELFPPPTSPPPCDSGLLYTRIDPYLAWIADRVSDLGEGNDISDPQDGGDPGNPGDPNDPGDPGDPGGAGGDARDDGGCSLAGDSASGPGGLALLGLAFAVIRRRRIRRA